MLKAKLLKHLGERKFIVEFPERKDKFPIPGSTTLKIAHDYVEIGGNTYMYQQENEDGSYPFDDGGAINTFRVECSLQIPIRAFKDVILPKLLESEYLNETHFSGGHGYTYRPCVVRWYSTDNKCWMITFRQSNSKVNETVTETLYNQIKYDLDLFDLNKKDSND